jgi:hypothetical protein
MKRILIGSFCFVIGIVMLFLFTNQSEPPVTEAKTLYDLAYDTDKRRGYTVYIKEAGVLEPYYVVTNDYYGQGNVLLLRKYLYDKPMPFQEISRRAYYGDSIPDKYLREEYILRFSKRLQESIPYTKFYIVAADKLPAPVPEEEISRQLFLLSNMEVGSRNFRKGMPDKFLPFFNEKDSKHRLAYTHENIPNPWHLRSSSRSEPSANSVVGWNGAVGSGGGTYSKFLRPALCLSRDTNVLRRTVNNEEVYVLDGYE